MRNALKLSMRLKQKKKKKNNVQMTKSNMYQVEFWFDSKWMFHTNILMALTLVVYHRFDLLSFTLKHVVSETTCSVSYAHSLQ